MGSRRLAALCISVALWCAVAIVPARAMPNWSLNMSSALGGVLCWGFNSYYLSIDDLLGVPSGLNDIETVEVGNHHACALSSTGVVTCWGSNKDGQATVPPDLPAARLIALGESHTCAVASGTGSVTCWGSKDLPVVPATVTGVANISAGGNITCIIQSSGIVACYGSASSGPLDPPEDLGPVSAIGVGQDHVCAANSSGVWCWGNNQGGECDAPPGLGADVQAISLGASYSCAQVSGVVTCWGDSTSSMGASTVPSDLGPVKSLSAAFEYNCALKADGSPACWGDLMSQSEIEQQLTPALGGMATKLSQHGGHVTCAAVRATDPLPDACGTLNQTCDATANCQNNPSAPNGFICVCKESGQTWDGTTCVVGAPVYCFSFYDEKDTLEYADVLHPPADLGIPVQVEVDLHACSLSATGSVTCWGHNNNSEATVPADLPPIKSVAVGTDRTCAIVNETGSVICWGGQLEGQVPKDVTGVVNMSMSWSTACTVDEAGTVKCYGNNTQNATVVPDGLAPATMVAAGPWHTCAATSEGVKCWGGCDRPDVSAKCNAPPDLGTDIIQLSAGSEHTCALTSEHKIICWGRCNNGECDTPADVEPAISMSAGSMLTCAISAATRQMSCWGYGTLNKSSTISQQAGEVAVLPSTMGDLTCVIRVPPPDKCADGAAGCPSGTTCVSNTSLPGGYICQCPQEGYAWDGAACNDIDECSATKPVCAANALCTNSDGGYSCACKDGFVGENGINCTDVNECIGDVPPCHDNATCKNTPGSFKCTCKAGFDGDGLECSGFCATNANCTGSKYGPICSVKEGRCRNCAISQDCANPAKPSCSLANNTCTACSSNTNCKGARGGPFCLKGVCVSCTKDSDCSGVDACNVTSHQCYHKYATFDLSHIKIDSVLQTGGEVDGQNMTRKLQLTLAANASTVIDASGIECFLDQCTMSWVVECPGRDLVPLGSDPVVTVSAGPGQDHTIDTTGMNSTFHCNLTLALSGTIPNSIGGNRTAATAGAAATLTDGALFGGTAAKPGDPVNSSLGIDVLVNSALKPPICDSRMSSMVTLEVVNTESKYCAAAAKNLSAITGPVTGGVSRVSIPSFTDPQGVDARTRIKSVTMTEPMATPCKKCIGPKTSRVCHCRPSVTLNEDGSMSVYPVATAKKALSGRLYTVQWEATTTGGTCGGSFQVCAGTKGPDGTISCSKPASPKCTASKKNPAQKCDPTVCA